MKKILAFALSIVLILSLCACTAKPEPTPVPTADPTPTPYETVSYRNHGKRVTVSAMPEKVITAGPNCTEVFCALGLEDKVIGRCMTNHSTGALSALSDKVDAIPVLNEGYPTLDEILGSGADFIYASSWIFTDNLTVDALEKAGITVFVNEADSLSDICAEIVDLARVFHVKEQGDAVVKEQTDRIEAVTAVVENAAPKKVLVIDSFVGDKVYTAGSGNIETEYIALAGGKNIFDTLSKPWDAVTVEEIAELNPDYIIIHTYKNSSYDDKVAAIKDNDVLSQLDCVKEERFVKFSLENFMPGMRSAFVVEKLSKAIQAEAYEAAANATPAPTETPAP